MSKEEAEVQWYKAQSISQLVYAGFTHESVRNAVKDNDLSKLRKAKKDDKTNGS